MCYRNVTKLECGIREGLANKTFVCWLGESVTSTERRSSSFCSAHPGAVFEVLVEGPSMLPMGNGAAKGDAEGNGKSDAAGGELEGDVKWWGCSAAW